MSSKHYENAANAKLSDIFPAEAFRLVPAENKDVPCGYSEIPVEIDLKRKFAETLSFEVPWDGGLYGFVRDKKQIYKNIGYDTAVKITLSDWDDKFTMIFEAKDGKEGPVYYISKEDMKNLFEKCMKPFNL